MAACRPLAARYSSSRLSLRHGWGASLFFASVREHIAFNHCGPAPITGLQPNTFLSFGPVMTYALPMPQAHRPPFAFARGLARRVLRSALIVVGMIVVLAGVIIAPLPGPMGLPVVVIGLVIILRNSFWARRAFVRAQRAYPNILYPLRRLLRREPEVGPVAWQQLLRVERMIVPRRWRAIVRWRRSLRRR